MNEMDEFEQCFIIKDWQSFKQRLEKDYRLKRIMHQDNFYYNNSEDIFKKGYRIRLRMKFDDHYNIFSNNGFFNNFKRLVFRNAEFSVSKPEVIKGIEVRNKIFSTIFETLCITNNFDKVLKIFGLKHHILLKKIRLLYWPKQFFKNMHLPYNEIELEIDREIEIMFLEDNKPIKKIKLEDTGQICRECRPDIDLDNLVKRYHKIFKELQIEFPKKPLSNYFDRYYIKLKENE